MELRIYDKPRLRTSKLLVTHNHFYMDRMNLLILLILSNIFICCGGKDIKQVVIVNNSPLNSGFESGLEGWEISGKVNLEEGSQAYKGKYCSKLEGPKAEIFQRVSVNPLSIVQLNGYAKTTQAEIQGCSFIRFYDGQNNLLIEYLSKPFSSGSYTYTGCYTLAPAKSKYLTFGIMKETDGGFIYTDEISFKSNGGEDGVTKTPIVNIDQYLQPFWKSDTVYNETILLLSENGVSASGKLLFNPSAILSVKSFDLTAGYYEGVDYTLNGNIITKIGSSSIPYKTDSFFPKNDLAWYNLQSQWIVVTYVHKDKWNGSVPSFKGQEMPNTLQKLTSHSPLRIVATGMSITRGMDMSGYDKVPPYMPSYVDLLVYQLKKAYGYNDIKLYNAALPGAMVDWAAKYADEYINVLNPDLVIIDFGMNDFWKFSPEMFNFYVQTIITKCKAYNNNIEFLLISNMRFDPDYIKPDNKDKLFYETNFSGYNTVLQSLCSKGIINLDMTTLSSEIYQRKKAKDCIANPLHPNDYMARWYAQGMAALLIESQN